MDSFPQIVWYSVMLFYLAYQAKKHGLLGFFAKVLLKNKAMLHFFEKMGYEIERRHEEGVYELKIIFQ